MNRDQDRVVEFCEFAQEVLASLKFLNKQVSILVKDVECKQQENIDVDERINN